MRSKSGNNVGPSSCFLLKQRPQLLQICLIKPKLGKLSGLPCRRDIPAGDNPEVVAAVGSGAAPPGGGAGPVVESPTRSLRFPLRVSPAPATPRAGEAQLPLERGRARLQVTALPRGLCAKRAARRRLPPHSTARDILIPGGLALLGPRLPRPQRQRGARYPTPPPVGIKRKKSASQDLWKRSFRNISGQQSEGGREGFGS